jgi:hypothetical protein
LECVVDVESKGVRSTLINWCDTNCNYLWGWHFDKVNADIDFDWRDAWVKPPIDDHTNNTRAFISFQDYDEMIIFKISCLST